MSDFDFEAVVIGSGFGGSFALRRLADLWGDQVCLMERGKKWPPGSFPRSYQGIARNFWSPRDGQIGLIQVWTFDKIDALVSSGLGGGSLIYANVLLRRPEHTFDDWPISLADLEPHYEEAERVLGAQRFPHHASPHDSVRKTSAFKHAAKEIGYEPTHPNLAITFGNDPRTPKVGDPIPGTNLHGAPRETCRLCGECDFGCNYGSKNTLDLNALSEAAAKGAVLKTECEVKTVTPLKGGGYTIDYVEHVEGTKYERGTTERQQVTARRVIIAAGAMGSTYLLLRSLGRDAATALPMLGHKFCGNGDLLGIALETEDDKGDPYSLDPSHGPVITTTLKHDRDGHHFYIQDGGFPAFLTWVYEMLGIASFAKRGFNFARWILRRPFDRDTDASHEISEFLGTGEKSAALLAMLGMGEDVADGVMSLGSDNRTLRNTWSIDSSKELFDAIEGVMGRLARQFGTKLTKSPFFKVFQRPITVHPLGGCPMGTSKEDGVVNGYGEVFGFEGLYVCDGAALPGPTGPNPALTIAAFADRCAKHIVDTVRK